MEILASIVAACLGVVLGWVTKTWRERRVRREHDELVIRRASDDAEERAHDAQDYKATRYRSYADRARDPHATAADILGLRYKPASEDEVQSRFPERDKPESD